MKDLASFLEEAKNDGWATGHFNVSESDQFRAICEAAAELRSPVLVGTSEGEARHLGRIQAVALRDAFRKELQISIFLNSDHHKSVDAAKEAIDAGYDSIHIDLSALPLEENIIGTKEIVEYARASSQLSVTSYSIEGELGYLRGESKIQKEKIEVRPEDYTDPAKAKEFIERTGVNRLAIAVGNIHGISLDEPALDIDRIKAIRGEIPEYVALVLHAGSGIPDYQIKAAIAAGIVNIHINTDIRVAYSKALKEEFVHHPDEIVPYKFDLSARNALKSAVEEKLRLFGSVNRI